jgi:hypothetical protein
MSLFPVTGSLITFRSEGNLVPICACNMGFYVHFFNFTEIHFFKAVIFISKLKLNLTVILRNQSNAVKLILKMDENTFQWKLMQNS